MKSNPLLNDIAKGLWAMSIQGLSFWAPVAHKIMSGEKLDLQLEPAAVMDVFDRNGRRVSPNENGGIDAPKGSVAVINVIGVLIKYGDWCTYGAGELVEALKAANDNPNIVGIVAYFDGPGGAVSAIPPFVEFAKLKKKPVIGLYDQCCSAHLYSMLSFCDYIMAENDISAMIGSIGVVLSFMDNRAVLEKFGYKYHEIYPEESEHKNEAIRLALEGKYEMIKKEMLSPIAIKFQDAVKAARPKLILEPGVLTGKVFYTDHAIDIKLVDGKGSLSDAMERVRIMGEVSQNKFIN